MSLNEGDYLKWYNDDITRYRNIEWRIAGYSMAVSWASILFTSNVPDWFKPYLSGLAIFILLFWVSHFFAEIHVHYRLNEYRAKRAALEAGTADHRKATGRLLGSGWRDILFLVAFLLFPVIVGLFAVYTILSKT